jgi:putative ABC transport system ATP-binding protein
VNFVELERVVKRYGEQRVLEDASLKIARGEHVAVIGRSGSGKSTLLRLIGGLETPDTGAVRVGGADLGTLGERDLALKRRRELGFVFQSFNLVPTLTVAENVELPLALNDIAAASARRRSLALLDELDLHHCAERFPEELSGGEQQRVAIARAVVHEPALVLADEPTGNLDVDTASLVLELLQRTCRERAATLVIATHSADVRSHTDRVIEIKTGIITEASR